MSVPMSQVLTTARTYLNDDNATQFPDPVLIPKIQEAHRELQEELWVAGSPLVRAQQGPLIYTAGTTSITDVNFPPVDFLCPTMLFENTAGSFLIAAGWTPMTEAFYIPFGIAQHGTLDFWVWQQENIILNGANVNRAMFIQYRRLIRIPVLSTDLIGVLFGESYLAPRAAGLAAGTVGNQDAVKEMTALAKENLSKIMQANRGQQRAMMNPGGSTGWPKLGGGRD